MFKDNTKQVNRVLAQSLLWCSLGLIALLITNYMGLFHFKMNLLMIIIIAGFMACCMPFILSKIGVPDNFLKYYIHISVSILIGLMGMNNSVGIYITFILVPIISCLYFDRRFTLIIGWISYCTMTLAVYVNCAGKMEVVYRGWSHLKTFKLYMIGFTIEYFVAMMFIYQLAKRSQRFLEKQQKNLKLLKSENERQKEMSDLYRESLTEQRKTAYQMLASEISSFTEEDMARLSAGQHFNAQLQEIFSLSDNFNEVMMRVLKNIGEYFKVDRIIYVETNPEEEKFKFPYQWVRKEEDFIIDFYDEMSEADYQAISRIYDELGYMEMSKKTQSVKGKSFGSAFGIYMYGKLLGVQLWIPTMENGVYNGAVCFDKYDETPYDMTDKILLTEIVGMICMNVVRVNANNANRAKSTFLSTMSHEIRTPMNAIIGMANVAMREDMNDEVRKSLSIIQSSAEGLLAIINDILDFSKIESGRVEIISENYQTLSLLNDVCTMAKARNTEKGLALNFEIDKDLPSVLWGDMVRIKQVMVNLATNAIKYTDEGSVTIQASCERREGNCAVLRYAVVDTGQGIKEEDLSKLFKSFSQINQEQNHTKEGTGLGLAISKQLVELMHGHIGVKSTYGVGSTFYFEIPQTIVDDTAAGDLEAYSYSKASSDKKQQFEAPDAKVLLVDDNRVNLKVALALFKPYKMQIDTATDGKIAVRMSKEKTYDLILMDNFMPEMNGMDATRAIRGDAENPNQKVPIVALTADVVMGMKEKMLEAGMDDLLSKPIDLAAADKIFRKYLEKDLKF